MILITTSNGVFRLSAEDPSASLVHPRDKGFFFFRKGSGGFFGICEHPDGDSYLAASREKLGTPRHDKPWTDVRLYRVWKEPSPSVEVCADVKDIHDVHQIATMGDQVVLTDTGKNRLGFFNLKTGKVWTLDLGSQRSDINHLNAVHVTESELLVGLNNRGHKPAEILSLDRKSLESSPLENDALKMGRVEVLGSQLHTHDVEPFGDDFLYCASHDGQVHRRSNGQSILNCGDWVRGLALNAEGLWVGVSALADRANRHRENLDGQIHLFQPDTLELIKSWQLVNAGQVNDIVAW